MSFIRITCLVACVAGLFSNVAAQSAEQPIFTWDYCVKVNPGKGADYADFLKEVAAKIAQAQIDEGTLASFMAARAYVPAGSSARCDYHILFSYVGWPPEGSRQRTEAAMKKAGLSMTMDEMLERRRADSYLVSAELWRNQALVGQLNEGSYVRLNYNKIKPGMMGEWLEMETTGWQKLVEHMREDRPEVAWGAATLALPGGTSREYDTVTFDAYPSWQSYGEGFPLRATWMKVHPQQDLAAYLNRMESLMDRPYIDIVKLDVVRRRQ